MFDFPSANITIEDLTIVLNCNCQDDCKMYTSLPSLKDILVQASKQTQEDIRKNKRTFE